MPQTHEVLVVRLQGGRPACERVVGQRAQNRTDATQDAGAAPVEAAGLPKTAGSVEQHALVHAMAMTPTDSGGPAAACRFVFCLLQILVYILNFLL